MVEAVKMSPKKELSVRRFLAEGGDVGAALVDGPASSRVHQDTYIAMHTHVDIQTHTICAYTNTEISCGAIT
jgi:hypothetical protein